MKDFLPAEKQYLALLSYGASLKRPSAEEEASLFGDELDWKGVYDLASAQGTVGVITDGIGCLRGPAAPVEDDIRLDPYLGDLLLIERRNRSLDGFIPKLFGSLLDAGLHPVLVKGQAIARIYPVPSHRESGDIDVLLPPDEYSVAREILLPKATKVLDDLPEILHVGMYFGKVEVELHGTVSTLMSPRLDCRLAVLLEESFRRGGATETIDGKPVPVPDADFNALYVFTHFLHHYWSEGVGFRQLLDWTLLLQSASGPDPQWLRSRLRQLRLLHLWEVFAGFAVEMFGADPARLPLYRKVWKRKNRRITRYLIRCGNFGHAAPRPDRDKDAESYLQRKVRSFIRLVFIERLRHIRVFPLASLRFFFGACRYGLRRLVKGE